MAGTANILFDLDGTLTDSGPGIMKAVQFAIRKCGGRADDLSALRHFVGPPLQASFLKEGFGRSELKDLVAAFREYYDSGGIFDNSVYDGVVPMLEELGDRGMKLFVATTKPLPVALRVLEHFGLRKYFTDVCGGSDDPVFGKKAAVIRRLLEKNGIADPGSCAMVGDAVQDITGAKENGMISVAVLYGYGEEADLMGAGPDLAARSPADIARLLAGRTQRPDDSTPLLPGTERL